MREYVPSFLRWRLRRWQPRASAQDDPSIHMVTYIEVVPATQGQVVTLLRQLANTSRKDAGLTRFEILQRTAPAREFVILESWKDQQSFDAHVASAHHKQFREKVTPHLIAPFDDRFSLPTLLGPSQAGRGGVVYVVTHVDVPGARARQGHGRAHGARQDRAARTPAICVSTWCIRRTAPIISRWSRSGRINVPTTPTSLRRTPARSATR